MTLTDRVGKVRFLKMLAVGVTLQFAYMFMLNTYWPFGDEARHLSNFDSLCRGFMIWLPGYAVVRWGKK